MFWLFSSKKTERHLIRMEALLIAVNKRSITLTTLVLQIRAALANLTSHVENEHTQVQAKLTEMNTKVEELKAQFAAGGLAQGDFDAIMADIMSLGVKVGNIIPDAPVLDIAKGGDPVTAPTVAVDPAPLLVPGAAPLLVPGAAPASGSLAATVEVAAQDGAARMITNEEAEKTLAADRAHYGGAGQAAAKEGSGEASGS